MVSTSALANSVCGNLDHVQSDIEAKGYCILKNAIELETINSVRDFWLNEIIPEKVSRKFVRGDLVLGETNFLSYSKIKDWCMFRNFDFLWNKQTHDQTTNLCVELHKIRNKLQGFDELFGLTYNDGNYGIYISTSLYPVNEGMLEGHADGHGALPILHFMVPLTFKKIHYEDGGLFVRDKAGQIVDIDSACQPGDLIFFDGRCEHGVSTIRGGRHGRLAVFAVPCHFAPGASLYVMLRSLKIWARELLVKLNLLRLLRQFRSPADLSHQ